MLTPSFPHVHVQASWDRPIVPTAGGPAILVTQITAPQRLADATPRPPLDIVFVLDRSGSMSGEPLALVKQAVSVALDFLDERDRVSLVTFDDEVRLWQELTLLTAGTKTLLRGMLRLIEAGGSTNLTGGWLAGCEQVSGHSHATHVDRIRRVILLTDGQANVGLTDAGSIAGIAGDYRQRSVATTTIGVGLHFDEMLLRGCLKRW